MGDVQLMSLETWRLIHMFYKYVYWIYPPPRIQWSPPGWLEPFVGSFRDLVLPISNKKATVTKRDFICFVFPVKFNTILQYFISWCTKKNPRKQHPRQNWGAAITNPLAVATMSMTLMKATIVRTSIRTNTKNGESLWWLNKKWEWLRWNAYQRQIIMMTSCRLIICLF